MSNTFTIVISVVPQKAYVWVACGFKKQQNTRLSPRVLHASRILHASFMFCTHLSCFKSKYKKVAVLPIRIVKSNVSSVGPSSERNTLRLSRVFFFRVFFFNARAMFYFLICYFLFTIDVILPTLHGDLYHVAGLEPQLQVSHSSS